MTVLVKGQSAKVNLDNFAEATLVRVQIEEFGNYMILGRLVLQNTDGAAQSGSARITTADGSNELDRVDLRINGDGEAQSISLQATLTLPSENANDIVDLRCSTFSGAASEALLFACKVDRIVIQ